MIAQFLRKMNILKYSSECGHPTRRIGRVSAFGCSRKMKAVIKDGQAEYCFDCLSKMAILCPWCSRAIHIGDLVTAFSPILSFQIPDHVRVWREEPLALLGCVSRGCIDEFDGVIGRWLPNSMGEGEVVLFRALRRAS